MKFDNLITAQLANSDDTEVVLSYVEVPPDSQLPTHWHPGEEFAYVIDGSILLKQEGEQAVYLKAGDAGAVPLKKIHTIQTQDRGAKLVVFRVHEKGQPERILIDAA